MKTSKSVTVLLIVGMLMMVSVSFASADPANPFAGHWLARDLGDWGVMRLAIAGNPSGPFQITWTEDYLSTCQGGPGIGKGSVDISGEYGLSGHIVFMCLSTGNETEEFPLTFVYDPASNTILDNYGNTWSRGGSANPFAGHWFAPDLGEGDYGFMRLTITGNPSGPFHITWTEDYWGMCQGGPGIGKGSGDLINEYVLNIDIVFTCFSSGDPVPYNLTFFYDPVSNTISNGPNIWNRGGPGNP